MTGPFSRTATIALVGVSLASLIATVALTIGGAVPDADPGAGSAVGPSAGADGYSVSAVGHRGLVELLERLGIPVVMSRSASAARARSGVLLVIEPVVTDADAGDELAALARAPRTLVVLPKWVGRAAPGAGWIDRARPMPVADVARVTDALGLDGVAIRRVRPPVAWVATPAPPVVEEPQLMATDELDAIAFDAAGNQLLGRTERDGRTLYVLSDPDVLNNAGLRTAENARFAVALIDRLRGDGPVVIDETMHGYAQQPSLVRVVLQFPLVLATVQVVACALLVAWAAMVRFGPRRAAPPPIAPGKEFLIRNTAALLHHGGHHRHALERYLQLTVAEVRHALHAPALAPDEATAWLERVRAARGGRTSLAALEQAVEAAEAPARVVELADQVYRWRMEMTHGTDSRS